MINLECEDWVKKTGSYQKPIILDVRTVEEYEEISIPNAVLANILEPNEFINVVEKFSKKSKIFVYCRSGVRSQKACNILDQLGFKETYNLNGTIISKTWLKLIQIFLLSMSLKLCLQKTENLEESFTSLICCT